MASGHLNLIYKLDGEFREGIDVFALAPVLLNVGKLIQESNKTLFPAGDEISINVKPFEEGSFIIDIALVPATVLEQIARTILPNDLSDIQALLEIIGLIGGGTVSLYKLMKFLGGKPKDVEPLSGGEVRYTAEGGTQIIVNGDVHNLYQNSTVTAAAVQSIAATLEINQVSDVKTYLKENEQDTKVVFEKKDADLLRAAGSHESARREMADLSGVVNTYTILLHPKKIDLEGAIAAWTFRKTGSKQIVKAKIADRGFLDRMKSGDVRLASNDVLKVEMVERQTLKDSVYYLTNEIRRVLVYQPAQRQTVLPLEASTSYSLPPPVKQSEKNLLKPYDPAKPND